MYSFRNYVLNIIHTNIVYNKKKKPVISYVYRYTDSGLNGERGMQRDGATLHFIKYITT